MGPLSPPRPEAATARRPGRKQHRATRAPWQGPWREAKGLRFSLVDDDRVVHLLRWQQSQDDAALVSARRQVKEAGVIPAEQVRLCVVAAGAHWIWNGVPQLFPPAPEILDYYPCAPHIHTGAEGQSGEQPQRALEGAEATRARLFAGAGEGVIGGRQRLRPATPEAAAAIETICAPTGKPTAPASITAPSGELAPLWAVEGVSRPTSAFALCGSTVRERGGM